VVTALPVAEQEQVLYGVAVVDEDAETRTQSRCFAGLSRRK
jgi:hypothetical protein